MEQFLVCHRTMILLLVTMFTPAKKMKGVDGAPLGMPQNNYFIIVDLKMKGCTLYVMCRKEKLILNHDTSSTLYKILD